jgi:hypothetical protein
MMVGEEGVNVGGCCIKIVGPSRVREARGLASRVGKEAIVRYNGDFSSEQELAVTLYFSA